jgi:hypothetical protein
MWVLLMQRSSHVAGLANHVAGAAPAHLDAHVVVHLKQSNTKTMLTQPTRGSSDKSDFHRNSKQVGNDVKTALADLLLEVGCLRQRSGIRRQTQRIQNAQVLSEDAPHKFEPPSSREGSAQSLSLRQYLEVVHRIDVIVAQAANRIIAESRVAQEQPLPQKDGLEHAEFDQQDTWRVSIRTCKLLSRESCFTWMNEPARSSVNVSAEAR